MQSGQFDFQRDVIEASKQTPIVVDFWAEWCGPCRVLGPVLEKLAEEANGAWKLVKVNTEELPQIAMQYRIQSIPAVKMFSDGQVVAEFIGALPETHVRKWLTDNLPTKTKKLLDAANHALENGEPNRAQQLFEEVLSLEKDNQEAKIRLAELTFESNPSKANDLVQDVEEHHPLFSAAAAIRDLYRLISDREKLEQAAEFSADAKEAWASYLAGARSLAQHDYDKALEKWIDALIVNRDIDDDGPRRACVALFTWLGQEHELTRKYHRAFTSALF